MDMTIDQQVALDEALVPHARKLRIGRSNFCLLSNISSKESTLQLVYDVLRLRSFFKAFLVTADVPEIYMQEFWATATVYHHSIREIRRLTDVNINKLHQPWRSFAAIINKCLSRKSLDYDSLRLSQAQFLWGFYHKRNVDFTYLLWEDFVYQVEHKDTKKSNEMYYPRFTKEYYAVAIGATPPKTKASVWKTKISFDTTVTPPLIAARGTRLFTSAKGKQPATTFKAKRTGTIPGVLDVPTEEFDKEISWKSSDEGDDDADDEEGDDGDDWKRIRLKRDKSEQKQTKLDKNGKRVEAGKSLKQLQLKEEEKPKKNGRKRIHVSKVIQV
nr:hypothetical protein [Tanacetum cinerariifolium]